MAGRKMSKRTGQFALPADIYEQGHPPRVLRYALLAAHYRAPLDFSEASLATAASAAERLATCLLTLDAYHEDRPDDPSLPQVLDLARERFREAMDDDLNIAPALGAIFEFVRDVNRRVADRSISTADAARAAAQLRDLDRVLAVAEDDAPEASALIDRLLAERAQARSARDWARADALRTRLAELDVVVEDTADGQRWRRATEAAHG
jgi:cysteinyl-tRNA synthetase